MKLRYFLPLLAAVAVALPLRAADQNTAREVLNIFDNAVFYDGYNSTVFDADLDDGILRHTNYLYARPLKAGEFLDGITDLQIDVTLGARCDNYDRFGRVSIALVEKGASTYNPDETDRIEVARFITPFMNKNIQPTEVPYIYEVDDLRQILRDPVLNEKYDFWMETEIFGMPYSANTEIKGCEGRNDVFSASVSLSGVKSESPAAPAVDSHLLPIYITRSEIKGDINFNNYNPLACDTLGVTTRSFEFTTDTDLSDAQIVMILTNHGANEGGEEYNRRRHIVYLDNEVISVYVPGGVNCEPYRKYNTQPNFIFGIGTTPEQYWRVYSNWCPGQAAPIRRLNLGALKAGKHTLMIRVPKAEFKDGKGDFRPSLYLQGVEEGTVLPSGVDAVEAESLGVRMTREADVLRFSADEHIKELNVYSYDGRLLEGRYNPADTLSLSDYTPGIYIILLTGESGRTSFFKVAR